MKNIAVEISNLNVTYRDKLTLSNVTLSIQKSTITGLLGPNGAGKSTLIKALLGLVPKLSGTVRFEINKNWQKNIAYLPQRSAVDWDYPVIVQDVVNMGRNSSLGWFGRRGKKDLELVKAAMKKTGVFELAKRPIGELSGGQQQRTLLARALAQDAEIFILDEPFAAVDTATEKQITSVLRDLKDEGKTIIIVVHNLSTIPDLCDNIVLLRSQQNNLDQQSKSLPSVVAHGSVGEVFTQENLSIAYGAYLPV